MRTINDIMFNTTSVSLSANSDIIYIPYTHIFDMTAVVTSANPANKTFTSANVTTATDQIAVTAHGYNTGTLVTLTTAGVLPTGLATSTNYYVIALTADTLQLATSQANALAGTAIDLTAAGSGTSTIVVTTTIAGSLKIQKNNEPPSLTPIWFDVATPASQNFTGTTTLNYPYSDAGAYSLRAVATVTSGTVTIYMRINGKGQS